VWISYSSEYDNLWNDHGAVDGQVATIVQSGIDIVFLSISSSAARPHLQKLSDRTSPFTTDFQYLLNRLAQYNVLACATILSDNFTGSASQMQRFLLTDYLLNFNASRGAADAGLTCVSTDLEMQAGSRRTAVYDLWKQFHSSMRD